MIVYGFKGPNRYLEKCREPTWVWANINQYQAGLDGGKPALSLLSITGSDYYCRFFPQKYGKTSHLWAPPRIQDPENIGYGEQI